MWLSKLGRYEFGVTNGSANSLITSNDLLAAIRYPDRSTGAPSASDKVTVAYNRLGEVRRREDQLGVVHTFEYDAAGRLLKNAATGGTGIDEWIDSIQLQYQSGTGRLSTVKSYSGTTVKNAVQLTYTDEVSSPADRLGLLRDFIQDPDGDIALDGSGNPTGNTRRVRYEYAIAKQDGGTAANNYARPSTVTYPTDQTLTVHYAPTPAPAGTRTSLASGASLSPVTTPSSTPSWGPRARSSSIIPDPTSSSTLRSGATAPPRRPATRPSTPSDAFAGSSGRTAGSATTPTPRPSRTSRRSSSLPTPTTAARTSPRRPTSAPAQRAAGGAA
jgi:YD repeat-containing protein